MNNGLVNHTEAEGTVRGPRSEVRGFMIILIMKKGKGRGLRRDPRPRSPPRSESESGNKRTKLDTLARQETVGWVGWLFSGSPAPPRQLVVAVAVVDVAGREQTTLSPAAARHGAPSPAVRPFSPAAQRAPACWLAEHWLQVHVMKLRGVKRTVALLHDLLLAGWSRFPNQHRLESKHTGQAYQLCQVINV